MTLAHADQCSPTTARALTDQLRQATAGLAQQYQVWEGLVIEAYQREAWRALGYGSWHAYVTAEVPELQNLRFGRDERQELVVSFRDVGMSTRAIGSALGIGQTQVRRDLDSGEPFGSRQPADEDDQPVDAEIVDAELVEDNPRPSLRVLGTDGKSYPADPPVRPRRRRPLPDVARELAHDLQKVVERAERLFADDRYAANAELVTHLLHHELEHATRSCKELTGRLRKT